jgi:hypothetical protein
MCARKASLFHRPAGAFNHTPGALSFVGIRGQVESRHDRINSKAAHGGRPESLKLMFLTEEVAQEHSPKEPMAALASELPASLLAQ